MSIGLAYWILMLVWLAFSLWSAWPNHMVLGGSLLVFLLFALVGWKVFGPPLHG